MKPSMLCISPLRDKLNGSKIWRGFIAALFWLCVWQVGSLAIGKELLLASPLSVFKRLTELVREPSFYTSIGASLSRIGLGFLLSLVVGSVLAVAAFRLKALRILLQPLMGVITATPVASYTILCLMFLSSRNLSLFLSFLMALPIVYTNLLKGLEHTDTLLLEMARVFRVGTWKRIVYIYVPQLMPFVLSACSLSIGLCWKAGVAAEVIGLPAGTIGDKLYQAKLYLDTADLLAWTAVIIFISYLLKSGFLWLLNRGAKALER